MLKLLNKFISLNAISKKTKYIKIIISVLVMLIFLCVMPAFKYERISSDKFIANNFSNLVTSENAVTVQFSPTTSNLTSLKLRAVTDPKFTTSTTEMLVKIIYKNEVLLEKTFSNSEITSGKMCVINVGHLKNNAKYTLEIKSNEVASGFLLVTGANGAKENQQWVWGDNVEQADLEIAYYYNDLNVKKFVLSFIFLIFAALFFLFPFELKSPKLRPVHDICIIALSSCLILYSVELLSFNSLSTMEPLSIIANILFIFALNIGFYLICLNRFIPVAITGIFFFIVGIINHFIVIYRKDVLVPSDLFAASTAANIISSYKFGISREIAMAAAILIFMLSISFNKHALSRKIFLRIATAIMGVGVLVCSTFFTSPVLHNKIGAAPSLYAPRESAMKHGLLLNFAMMFSRMQYVSPNGYSPEALATAAFTSASSAAAELAPNIIIIMNESLADLNDLGPLPVNTDYLPFIHSLEGQKNSYLGRAVVPVFGGGTSNTEFEALTGFSFACAPVTQAPYLQFIRGKTPSLAQTLTAQNYTSSALHLCDKRNWYRNTAYPQLGFQHSLFIEDFATDEIETCREVATDLANYNVILREYKKAIQEDMPFFNFSVTIQNHGGYSGLFDCKDIFMDVEGYSAVKQYLNLAKMSDNGFEYFISEIEQINQPTLVVMFGDHYPAFPTDFYGYMATDNPLSENEISPYYKTPVVMWANFDIDTDFIPPVFSINYLQSIILDAINMPKTPMQCFLSSSMQQLPVFSSMGFVDQNNNFYKDLSGTEYENILTEYSYWQYGGLFNSKNMEELYYAS